MAQIQWVKWEDGGAMVAPYLTREIHEAVEPWLVFDPLCSIPDDFGPDKGEAYNYAIEGELDAPISFTSNTLSEVNPVPLATWTHQRGSIEIKEIGRGAAFTKKGDLLGRWDLNAKNRRKLQRHLRKVLDDGAAAQFFATDAYYTPTGVAKGVFSLTGTAGGTAVVGLNAFHIRELVDYAQQELKIPPYDNDGNYVFVTNVRGRRGVYDDPEFEHVQTYLPGQPRSNGEIGNYYKARFVITNHTTCGMCGTGSVCPKGVLIGEDGVEKPVVAPPMIVGETADFGRIKKVAWLAYLGYGIVWKYTVHGGARIIQVGSQ